MGKFHMATHYFNQKIIVEMLCLLKIFTVCGTVCVVVLVVRVGCIHPPPSLSLKPQRVKVLHPPFALDT